MTQAEREAAAKAAAVGFFKAAGFTFDEAQGRFTDMDTVYEIMIPGSDHPAYAVAARAAGMLRELGVILQVMISGYDWFEVLNNNMAMMWSAAWGAAADPDMTQNYHSENAHGNGANTNHYAIDDPLLDELIERGRSSADTEERKAIYKEAMELVMDWGVELPYYQRKNATIFCAKRVDLYTLPADMTPYYDWMAEIEKLALLGTGPLNGDVDGNGVVDARDARALFLAVSERAFTPTAEELEREDMIRDGVLNNRDVIRLFRLAAGIE
jgi:peptide/nickel transport system substrate-binding protein